MKTSNLRFAKNLFPTRISLLHAAKTGRRIFSSKPSFDPHRLLSGVSAAGPSAVLGLVFRRPLLPAS